MDTLKSSPTTTPAGTPKLLDQVRDKIRLKHYSISTEQVYEDWGQHFVLFSGKRHPATMGAAEVEAFLTRLAVAGQVFASTKNQAKSAILFLFREVLGMELPWLDGVEQAKASRRMPVVKQQHEDDLRAGYDIRTVQELLGHKDVTTTMIYTHVLNRGGRGVASPLDAL